MVAIGALVQATCRAVMTPIEVAKNAAQVDGKGSSPLRVKWERYGYHRTYFAGTGAVCMQSVAAHLPWMITFQYLNQHLPTPRSRLESIYHSALVGFSSAVVADLISNPFRVAKTIKQTHHEPLSYSRVLNIMQETSSKNVLADLFGRGLPTRVLLHGLQGTAFGIVYQLIVK